MARTVVMDELHLTVTAPAGRPDPFYRPIRRALTSTRFLDRLRRAVRDAVRADPALAGVRVAIAR